MRFDFRRLVRRILLPSLVLLATLALAQDDDGLFAESDSDAPATLNLNFDYEGALQASLTLPQGVDDSDMLPALLTRSLHCPFGALRHPDGSEYTSPDFQKNWSASRRERFRKQMTDFDHRILSGHCGPVLATQDPLVKGYFDFSSLVPELQRLGVDQLTIYVETPKTQFRDYTRANLIRNPMIQSTALVYRIPVQEGSKPPLLYLAYGFRPADLHRALAILAGFIVLPVLLTLWMRRRALALAKMDAAAAWFGFFRTLNWLVLGASLLWLTSGFGARQTLEDWIASQGFSMWKATILDVAAVILPAWIPYFLCIALSYPVHAQLRGTQWTRREFLLRQMVLVGVKAMPLMIVMCAVGILHDQPESAVGLLFFSFLVLQILLYLRFRITKELPQPLTTGELRDRVFALAGRLGVAVSQIFIVPAGKGQIANAYAAGNRIVMFTDYLLEHLNKREVDGVAAHELGHLRHKHPGKRLLVFGAALCLPFYFMWLSRTVTGLAMVPLESVTSTVAGAKFMAAWWRALFAFDQWSQKDFILLMIGMTGFYFYSRHCENVADAAAVRLTGDAEAQITGLLKISRLNLIPIRWGKASESWLTHPSTLRRVQRMAAAGGLAPERLQEILQQYESQASTAKIAPAVVPLQDRYTIPPAADPEKLRMALRARSRSQAKLWLILMFYVVPPTLISVLIDRLNLAAYASFATYAGGLVITAILITFAGVWVGESGKVREKQRLTQRFEREHIPAGRAGDIVAGFAQGPYPRVYGSQYHWDSGFLVFSKDRLQFVGEQVKFSFQPSEIAGIVVGRGGPSWWKFERIYVRWKTEDGRDGIFNLDSLEPGSVWRTNHRVRELYREIERWRQQHAQYPEARPELADLKTLELGQVTSISPRKLGAFAMNLRLLAYLVPLAIGFSLLTHTEVSYLIASIVVLRVIHSIPYWRYRDVIPAFPQNSGAVPKARGAALG